jgi:uncharacterized cupin superfamily protein
MDVFNFFAEQDWEHENDRPGYRHRRTVGGERFGAALLGGSLYELPPGEKTWPYHYETGCEEWLIAVSGRATLRGPDGERELTPGDVAVFPEGPAGGHQVINRSDDACRVLILSSKSPLAVVHYPRQPEGRALDGGRGLPSNTQDGAQSRLLGRTPTHV